MSRTFVSSQAVAARRTRHASPQRLASRGIAFAAGTLALIVSLDSRATERFDMRYAPGVAGSEMTAPLEPGTYFQMPIYLYRGTFTSDPISDVRGAAELFAGPLAGLAAAFPNASVSTPVRAKIKVEARALLPRLTYMSTEQLWGATVGATAMLRLVEKRSNVSTQAGDTSVSNVDGATLSGLTGGAVTLPQLQSGANARVVAGAASLAADQSGKQLGLGDLELGVVMRWNRDPDQILFAPAVVLPTGDYKKDRTVNPASGNFYTFRPAVQYGHIADGWDIGARVTYSFNTKNKDTNYRSGDYLNLDVAWMKSISDALRLGVNGYAFVQTTKDRMEGTPTGSQLYTVGKRGQVFGVGPAVAWIKGAGEMLLEARAYKEFGAQDRPEGEALWLTLSMPIQ